MKRSHQENTNPKIKGLILVGGKSSRMGTDKSELNYHGKSQKEFMKELLENQGIETFYSVRDFSTSLEMTKENSIKDVVLSIGPIGGIHSAFQKDSNSAWFVLATDLPFINESVIELLFEKRNPEKLATAVQGKSKDYPEPLIAIYEPKAYSVISENIYQGEVSPRKLLMNSDVEIVKVDDDLIRNINTTEEFQEAKKELGAH